MNPPDLLVPVGRKILRKDGVPLSIVGSMEFGVERRKEAQDLAYRLGGRDKKPVRPIMVYRPNGDPIYLLGAGHAEASELEDLALKAMEQKPFDFDEAREKAGYPERGKTVELVVDAVQRHRKKMRGEVTNYPLRGRKR